MTPDELHKRILFSNRQLLVLDKPAGLPVHGGPSGKANLEQFLPHLTFDQPEPPALAHRLDQDTSGCLVLGRTPKALRKLGRLFSSGNVAKTYWAITSGHPPETSGTIDLPLLKQSTKERGWWMEVNEQGKSAVTDYQLLGKTNSHSWLELHPRTGRTHQLRVHLAALGSPIVGETLYIGLPLNAPGQPPLHLHSRQISLPWANDKPPLTVPAPPPEHMLALLADCGWQS